MADWTVHPKITQNDFQETNHVTFQKQHFWDVLQILNFENSQENTCAGVSVISYETETPEQVFSCEFCRNFQNIFYRTLEWLLLTLHCNSIFKKNLSDFSTMQCLVVFFGNFLGKCLQLNLLFTLRLQLFYKYLKSQNKRVLLQNFQLSHIQTSCIF